MFPEEARARPGPRVLRTECWLSSLLHSQLSALLGSHPAPEFYSLVVSCTQDTQQSALIGRSERREMPDLIQIVTIMWGETTWHWWAGQSVYSQSMVTAPSGAPHPHRWWWPSAKCLSLTSPHLVSCIRGTRPCVASHLKWRCGVAFDQILAFCLFFSLKLCNVL